ncbi:MAG: hypothetical protein WC901_01515 [Candidatus Margulisiibacteriota bacterium]
MAGPARVYGGPVFRAPGRLMLKEATRQLHGGCKAAPYDFSPQFTYLIGPPVYSPEVPFARGYQRDAILSDLRSGTSCLLIGPSRSGKRSLLIGVAGRLFGRKVAENAKGVVDCSELSTSRLSEGPVDLQAELFIGLTQEAGRQGAKLTAASSGLILEADKPIYILLDHAHLPESYLQYLAASVAQNPNLRMALVVNAFHFNREETAVRLFPGWSQRVVGPVSRPAVEQLISEPLRKRGLAWLLLPLASAIHWYSGGWPILVNFTCSRIGKILMEAPNRKQAMEQIRGFLAGREIYKDVDFLRDQVQGGLMYRLTDEERVVMQALAKGEAVPEGKEGAAANLERLGFVEVRDAATQQFQVKGELLRLCFEHSKLLEPRKHSRPVWFFGTVSDLVGSGFYSSDPAFILPQVRVFLGDNIEEYDIHQFVLEKEADLATIIALARGEDPFVSPELLRALCEHGLLEIPRTEDDPPELDRDVMRGGHVIRPDSVIGLRELMELSEVAAAVVGKFSAGQTGSD